MTAGSISKELAGGFRILFLQNLLVASLGALHTWPHSHWHWIKSVQPGPLLSAMLVAAFGIWTMLKYRGKPWVFVAYGSGVAAISGQVIWLAVFYGWANIVIYAIFITSIGTQYRR